MSSAEARALFEVGPADYVARRDEVAKEMRASGDKAGAAALKRLTRPSLSMWAVLAAGGDDQGVRELVEATERLGTVQGGGGDRAAVQEATRHRRELLDAFTDGAVDALRRFEASAPARRIEIRTIVDQLARHPELAEAWIDGTLRDLPDAGSGFEAFGDMDLPVRESREAHAPAARQYSSTRPAKAVHTTDDRADDTADGKDAEREAQRRRAAELAEARQAVRTAKDAAGQARRAAAQARADLERATKALRQAEAAERAADEAVTAATDRLEALDNS